MLSKRPSRPIPHSRNAPRNELTAGALDTPELVLAFCEAKGLIKDASLGVIELIEHSPELSLVYKNLGEYDAYIKKIAENEYEIAVNSAHHKNRQRFSIAHEYAHYQLHREQIADMPEGEQILHRSEERNSIETQANRFAAEILMPERSFLDTLHRVAGSVAEMAKKFKVSQLALRYRAKSLGIGGHGV